MEKIRVTKKMMFEALRGLAESGSLHMPDFNEDITDDDVIAFCDKEIAALEAKAAKAKETAAKKKVETDELKDAVLAALTAEPQILADIAAATDSTVGKIVSRLTALVLEGKVEKTQVTIGETGAKRKVSAYRLKG